MKICFRIRPWYLVAAIFCLSVVLIPSANAEVIKVVAQVRGMACPFCAYGIEKKLKKVSGVRSVDIDIQKGLATLRAIEGQSIAFDQVPRAIKDAGFTSDRITVTALGKIASDKGGILVFRLEHQNFIFYITDPSGRATQYRDTGKDVEVTGTASHKDGGRWIIEVERIEEIK